MNFADHTKKIMQMERCIDSQEQCIKQLQELVAAQEKEIGLLRELNRTLQEHNNLQGEYFSKIMKELGIAEDLWNIESKDEG